MRLSMGQTSIGLDISTSMLSNADYKVPKIDIIVGSGVFGGGGDHVSHEQKLRSEQEVLLSMYPQT